MKGLAYAKSKKPAIRIVKLYSYLRNEKKEYVMSKQLLRSDTSIGANLAESECAISRADFTSKVYTALKEVMETLYWLELLNETEFITDSQYADIYSDVEELRRMLSSTTKTMTQSQP